MRRLALVLVLLAGCSSAGVLPAECFEGAAVGHCPDELPDVGPGTWSAGCVVPHPAWGMRPDGERFCGWRVGEHPVCDAQGRPVCPDGSAGLCVHVPADPPESCD